MTPRRHLLLQRLFQAFLSFVRRWTTKASQSLFKLVSWILRKLPELAHSHRYSHQTSSHDRPSTLPSDASTQFPKCRDIESETVPASNTQATSQEVFIAYSNVPKTNSKRQQTSAKPPPPSRARTFATSTDSTSLTNINALGYSPPVSPTQPFSSLAGVSPNVSPTHPPHRRRSSGGTHHARALSSGTVASGGSGSISIEHQMSEISYARTVLTPQGLPLFSSEPAILEDQVEVESPVDEHGAETHEEIPNRHSTDSGSAASMGEGLEFPFDPQEQEQGPSTPVRKPLTRTKRIGDEASAPPTVVVPKPDIGIPTTGPRVVTQSETTAEPARIISKPIRTFPPSETKRYDRGIVIQNNQGPWVFPPLSTLTIREDELLPSWNKFIQQEGQPYFVNATRASGIHFVTEADLFHRPTREEVECFLEAFEAKYERFRIDHKKKVEARRSHSRQNSEASACLNTGPRNDAEGYDERVESLPNHVEAVLQIDDGEWKYYLVDLERQLVFWIDDIECNEDSLPGHFGVEYVEQFRNHFQAQFWSHVEYFPCHRPLIAGVLDELQGIILSMHVDLVSSKTTTAIYDKEVLEGLMTSVKNMMQIMDRGGVTGRDYVAWASARLMALLYSERFINFWGFAGARLSNNQSVRGDHPRSFDPSMNRKRSLVYRFANNVLFYQPEEYLGKIEDIYVDKVAKTRSWKSFNQKMAEEFIEYILYGTVLLNANVAYLSIPTVQSDQNFPDLWTSNASIVSTISMVLSLGSIIIGLVLVRQQRKGGQYAEDGVKFLEARNHFAYGSEMLAILLSLPYVFLLLAIISFAVAVALTCFTITANIDRHIQIPVYIAVWGFVILLIIGTLLSGGEGGLSATLQRLSPARPIKHLARLRLKVRWPEKETIKEVELGMRPSIGGCAGLGTSASGLGRGDSTKKRKGSWLSGLNVPTIVIERKSEDSDESDNEEHPAASNNSVQASGLNALIANPRPQSIPSHYHVTADNHSVRSTHSRFTTYTAVSGERARRGVKQAMRRMTDGTGRAFTLFIPRVATSSRRGAGRVGGQGGTRADAGDGTAGGYI